MYENVIKMQKHYFLKIKTQAAKISSQKFEKLASFYRLILIPIGNQTRFVNQTFFLQENEDDTYQ